MADHSTSSKDHDASKQDKASPVQHSYHDFSKVVAPHSSEGPERGGKTFPLRLHEMLSIVEMDNLTHIVSWQPHGRCFLVHRQDDFVNLILGRYFRQSKMASFQRQLNLYGFQRLTADRDKNAYYHELFLRGKRFLTRKIKRNKIKGEGGRKASSPHSEPDFYSMETLPPAETVRHIEGDDRVKPTVNQAARSSGSWPFATAVGRSPLSYPILSPTLASLTSNMPTPNLPVPNLALELALRRTVLQNPQLSSSMSISLATEALHREQAQLAPVLPPNLLLRQGDPGVSGLTSQTTEGLPLTPHSSTGATDHRIAMLLKNYYG